jgi:hypothetical protein
MLPWYFCIESCTHFRERVVLDVNEWEIGQTRPVEWNRDKRVDVAWAGPCSEIEVMPDATVGDSTAAEAGWTAAAQGLGSLGIAMPKL